MSKLELIPLRRTRTGAFIDAMALQWPRGGSMSTSSLPSHDRNGLVLSRRERIRHAHDRCGSMQPWSHEVVEPCSHGLLGPVGGKRMRGSILFLLLNFYHGSWSCCRSCCPQRRRRARARSLARRGLNVVQCVSGASPRRGQHGRRRGLREADRAAALERGNRFRDGAVCGFARRVVAP